jgi:hypothetical protein
MKDLINAIIAFLNAAITAGDVSAKTVIKGFDQGMPDEVPIERYPYIAIDEGGERVEADTSAMTQKRIRTINFLMAVIVGQYEDSLDAILDLSDEVKAEIEKQANRQLDGHTWGITITPIDGELDVNTFFRGRQVSVEFNELEDNYGEF